MINAKLHFDSRVIHDGLEPENWQGSTLPPIYQSASVKHKTAKSLSDTFAGKTKDHIYMRLSNPTNTVFEDKIKSLEGGQGAVVMASGMAAISNTCMALLRSGDRFIAGKSLFMSTHFLFTGIFNKYNIEADLVDTSDTKAIEDAITDRTRFIYLETIEYPKLNIPDIEKVANIAHKHQLPIIVDNTLASPWLLRPIEKGADIVVHSTTKYLSGHGASTGGIVIDSGNFTWPDTRFPDFKPFIERKGNLAFLDKVWREQHIIFGTTQAPFHSFLAMIGLDTLALRMERHMSNAIKVANFLNSHPKVKWVNFPGLETHPDYTSALRLFGEKGFGAMITFGLSDETQCFSLINSLDMIYNLANLGDCKTLIIHPWSSQYVSFEPEVKTGLSITPDLLRLSVGIENADDIIQDLENALKSVS